MNVTPPMRVLQTAGTDPKKLFHGIYLASVANNNDPTLNARVTLYIPQVLGRATSNWAVSADQSAVYPPATGTVVFVQFIGGDVNHPVYFFAQTENWTPVTPPASYTGTLRYKLHDDNTVVVNCDLTVPSSASSGTLTLITGLPASHTVKVACRGPLAFIINGSAVIGQLETILNMRWSANTDGTFTIQSFPGGASGTGVSEIAFTAYYPVD